MKTVKVGLIGCGNICDIYFQQCENFNVLEIVACVDLISEIAEELAS